MLQEGSLECNPCGERSHKIPRPIKSVLPDKYMLPSERFAYPVGSRQKTLRGGPQGELREPGLEPGTNRLKVYCSTD